jgi:hypothetical protein
MLLPDFPTETEIDSGYPVLASAEDGECFAAIQRAECLSRVIGLLEQIPLTSLERAMVHAASERSASRAPTRARKEGVGH